MKTTKKKITKKPTVKTETPRSSSEIRVNKYLADQGVGSRRTVDKMIEEGRVSLAGDRVLLVGDKIHPKKDEIWIDNVPLEKIGTKKYYYMMNKPRGVVTTLSDPEGRPCIKDFLQGAPSRIYPVGRLDYETEGLLLLTNDGDLAQKLAHPRYEKTKVYRIKVKGKPSAETMARLRKGMKMEDGWFKPEKVVFEESAKANTWFKITIVEGRNRILRRAFARLGHHIAKLVRIKFAGLSLGTLKPGVIRRLRKDELALLGIQERS